MLARLRGAGDRQIDEQRQRLLGGEVQGRFLQEHLWDAECVDVQLERLAWRFRLRAGAGMTVPFAMAHYVENSGNEPLRYLEMFRSNRFVDFSLNQSLGLTPPELVQAHLNLDQPTTTALRKDKAIIVK